MQIKLTEKDVPDTFIMLCCFGMSLDLTTENLASVSGFFIKWSSRKTKKNDVAKTLARVLLFAPARAHSVMN